VLQLIAFAGITAMAWNGDGADEMPAEAEPTPVEIRGSGVPTLGGMQFWADCRWLQGWKIQQHVYTHHCRLLDPRNRRHHSGSLEECEAALQYIQRRKHLAPDTGRAVILIHGIVRTSRSLEPMAAALRSTHQTVIGFEYPSAHIPIEKSAEYLRQLIASLTEVDEIDLVVHSMGGLVVRSYLQQEPDPRLHRMVMLGTPNRGSEMADLLQRNPLYRLVMGPAGQQLVTDPEASIQSLPVPDFEFAVVAGGNGKDGYNPLLPGDDDGTVAVDSVRLAGAADSLRVPVLHTFLTRDERVVRAAKNFLVHGRLREEGAPVPVVE